MPTTQIIIAPPLFSHHCSDPFEGTFDISGLFWHFNYIQHYYSQFKINEFQLVKLHFLHYNSNILAKNLQKWTLILILSLVQFKIMGKCQKLLLFIKKCSFSIFVFYKFQLTEKKSEKYFKWNIWNSGKCIIILDILNKMYQPL